MINIGVEDDAATSARLVAAARLDPRSSQVAFRTLLDALARPGLIVRIPPDLLPAEVPAPLLVPLALADIDVRIAVTGSADAVSWARVVAGATGGRPCALEAADIVAALEYLRVDELLAMRRGRPDAPEDGARVSIGCRRLTEEAGDAEVTIDLAGPGVPGLRLVGVDGVDARLFVALSQVNDTVPLGVDAWLVADDGAVVGLPRSTAISVVDPPGPFRAGSDRRSRAATRGQATTDPTHLSKGT